ncbi:F-box domain-containing protein [Colletotrichum scovillei]|uniref:F-box domain-containing protein n=1 Tax=Colletotrichum scovillei TaxID=1209932 RepID=A0A9P7R9B7_9PEZI|nr:F-box domain-containing protein [Colletotrichum scovillei]KAG7070094.1 F-box domain-containing protein [Colletotrichum scovillei]KAG7078342.1 F-box domain-containing protein [Colletotrichum scovillei]
MSAVLFPSGYPHASTPQVPHLRHQRYPYDTPFLAVQ